MNQSFPEFPEVKGQSPHEQQMFLLGRIFGEIKGINKHLADLNGTVVVHTKDIRSLQDTRAENLGERRAVGRIAAGVSFIISAAVSIFGYFLRQ